MIEIVTNYFLNLFNKIKSNEETKINPDEQVINGSYRVSNIQVDTDLRVNGQAILDKNVLVQKNMIVNGKLVAKQASILADLTVNGSASITATQVNGLAKFRGNLEANSTKFLTTIEILSSSAHLKNATTQDILLKKMPGNFGQRLNLSEGTEVNGDITFEAGNGEVFCDTTSKIHGKIIGGALKHNKGIFG